MRTQVTTAPPVVRGLNPEDYRRLLNLLFAGAGDQREQPDPGQLREDTHSASSSLRG